MGKLRVKNLWREKIKPTLFFNFTKRHIYLNSFLLGVMIYAVINEPFPLPKIVDIDNIFSIMMLLNNFKYFSKILVYEDRKQFFIKNWKKLQIFKIVLKKLTDKFFLKLEKIEYNFWTKQNSNWPKFKF